MGPSGSGKTTLLSIMGCLLTPDAGSYALFGTDVGRLSDDERSIFRRHHLGFIFQAFRLFRALSALENVLVALEIAGQRGRGARRRAADVLGEVGLGDELHGKPRELSGGERQRVAIARALVNDPRILLADEPTASLDEASGRQIAVLLHDLAAVQGRTVVVVSHDPRLLPFADRAVTLRDGRLVEDSESASRGRYAPSPS